MVEAARDAARRVAGVAFTPSGLLLREAIEAALAAAPQPAPDDKLREAARMALEALEMARPQVVGGIPLGSLHAAQEALRDALKGKE